jgi:long-chain acyl-CoA synthetase
VRNLNNFLKVIITIGFPAAGTDNMETGEPAMSQNLQKKPWLKAYPPGIDWNADIPVSTMPELIGASMARHADRECLDFMGATLTYRETGAMVDRFAKGLQDLGIGKGARVGLCLPNSPFYVVAYHGILKAGAIVVNFNPLYAEKEIRDQINDSQVETMVTLNVAVIQPKVEKMLGVTPLKRIIFCELADALPPVKAWAFRALNVLKGYREAPRVIEDAAHIPFSRMMHSSGAPAPVAITPDDVAVLQYTGGTTGIPKAAQLTHANVAVNTRQAAMWFTAGGDPGAQLRMLAVLPFFHVFSMTVQMNLTLFSGGALIMLPKFELKTLLKSITRDRPTVFAGVPTLYRAITGYAQSNPVDLSSLKLCVSGGAPLPDNVREDFKALTGLELVEGYGLSETSPLATGNPINGMKKTGSIGLPMPRTEIRLISIDTNEEAPGGALGEIRIRGPQVMKGYWNRPDETAKVIDKDGFLCTGDIGFMDADGYVFIVDRIKDMIIASGFKVFPRKVEEIILQHPAVAEVMVAGIRDEYRGETVKAWIVLKEGTAATDGDLRTFLHDKLAAYEMPKQVEFRLSLPKTLIGKPDRKALLAEEKAKASIPA